MPNVYESDVHLPRWKRAVFWLLESPTGIAVWGIPLVLLVSAPTYWFGVWWPLLIAVAGLSFALGWSCARRHAAKNGRIDPL